MIHWHTAVTVLAGIQCALWGASWFCVNLLRALQRRYLRAHGRPMSGEEFYALKLARVSLRLWLVSRWYVVVPQMIVVSVQVVLLHVKAKKKEENSGERP